MVAEIQAKGRLEDGDTSHRLSVIWLESLLHI